MNDFERLTPLAQELDRAYSQALDRLQAMLVDSVGLNTKVSQILECENLQVIPVVVDAMPSPKEVFVSFANALAGRVLTELSVGSGRDGHRIHDLVDWSDAPTRGHQSDQEHQLAKIEHARSKSMVAFLRQLIIRFNPTALPNAAVHRAIEDTIQTFSVATAIGVAIPVRRDNAPAVFRYVFHRQDDEPMWQMLPRHHAAIVRGANAFATMALLDKKHAIAASLADMLNSMDVRLSNTMMRYEPNQSFHAAAFLKLTLQRDGADFHIGSSLFEIVEATLREHVSDVSLVYH